MKRYIHARLDKGDREALDALKRATGESESALVRRGLLLVSRELGQGRGSALERAGRSAGKFRGPRDLSTNPKHLDRFGE
jgi:hypothetical protein